MKFSRLRNLNGFGFSHVLVPILAVVIIGGIGSYVAVISKSHADTVPGTEQNAVNYAQSQQVASGVAVYDMQTKALYSAGNATGYFGSASVMKLFVADKLLVTGKMTGSTEATAYKMITQSDDASLEQLLPTVGGTAVVSWVAKNYNIPTLGVPPVASKASCWGATRISANGMALFLNAMAHDTKASGWLVNAMAHYSPTASDGTNQMFGIPSAAPTAAIKQGWGSCSSLTNGSVINSTGIVQNRYVVVILTNTNRWSTNSDSFNANQAAVVSRMAGTILPNGQVHVP